MRRILVSTLLVAMAATPLIGSAGSAGATPGRAGRYIVVLEDGANPAAVANEHAREHAAEVSRVYSAALKGYAAVIPEARLDEVRSDSRVAYVEADGVATVVHHCKGGHSSAPECDPPPDPPQEDPPQEDPPSDPVTCPGSQYLDWGVDYIGGDASSTLSGNCQDAVSGVTAYVIDSGAGPHSDLNVVGHVNYASGPNKDCNGHGTHVAGTIGARDNTSDVVGVAPGVPIVGVKVLGCNGSGWYSDVIAGVDYVARQNGPRVANMSLGGPKSTALENAIAGAVDDGVFFALAAGNEGEDACGRSPAGLVKEGSMTVGAIASSGSSPSWSNYGNCVEIWAPGVSIRSTSASGGTTTMSGTSMAAPHVAGAAALWLSGHSGNPSQVESAILGADTAVGPRNVVYVATF